MNTPLNYGNKLLINPQNLEWVKYRREYESDRQRYPEKIFKSKFLGINLGRYPDRFGFTEDDPDYLSIKDIEARNDCFIRENKLIWYPYFEIHFKSEKMVTYYFKNNSELQRHLDEIKHHFSYLIHPIV